MRRTGYARACCMDGGSLVLTTRPIGGAYPEYRSLPPGGFEHCLGYANDAPRPATV